MKLYSEFDIFGFCHGRLLTCHAHLRWVTVRQGLGVLDIFHNFWLSSLQRCVSEFHAHPRCCIERQSRRGKLFVQLPKNGSGVYGNMLQYHWRQVRVSAVPPPPQTMPGEAGTSSSHVEDPLINVKHSRYWKDRKCEDSITLVVHFNPPAFYLPRPHGLPLEGWNNELERWLWNPLMH